MISRIYPAWFYVWNSKMWFNGSTKTLLADNELWSSDGTASGTVPFKDINPGTANSYAQHFFGMGNKMYFRATQDPYGIEPWITDGTPAGTMMIKDIRTTIADVDATPAYFFNYNNHVYFTATDNAGYRKLFRTDGLSINTFALELGIPGDTSKNASDQHAICNGALYMSINMNSTNGIELWKYEDTTAAGISTPNPWMDFEVFPNPSSGNIKLYIPGNSEEAVELSLTSVTGQTVFEQACILKAGINNFNSRVIGTGIYYLRIKSSEGVFVKKVVIQ